MQGNDFIKILLHSPLQGVFSGSLMLITVTGRRSGRAITTPVNYYSEGDTLWVLSNRNRNWWRNVCGGTQVTLHLRGHQVKARAETILDEETVAKQLGEYIHHLPMTAGSLGVRLKNGVINCEDTQRLAKEKIFVRICLN